MKLDPEADYRYADFSFDRWDSRRSHLHLFVCRSTGPFAIRGQIIRTFSNSLLRYSAEARAVEREY